MWAISNAMISNVPIGVAVLIGISIILHIKQANDANKRLPFKDKMWRLDPLGVISFIGAICCLLLALQWGGQTLPWSSSKIIGLFIGFGLCITGFCVIQWKLDEAATIPFRILRQRSILMGSFYLFFLGMTVYVVGNVETKPACLMNNISCSTLSTFRSISRQFEASRLSAAESDL